MSKFKIILMFCGLFLLSGSLVFAEPIAVIVNKNNPHSDISLSQLGQIYQKKLTKWSYGIEIIPLDREFGAGIRDVFSEAVNSKSAKEIKEYWLDERYKGVTPPRELNSSELVKIQVASKVQAIGYVYLNEVDNTVKILKINGLSPNDLEYKIK